MTRDSTIDTSQSLNELLARAPEALPVLQRFGLDTCCGGSLSLAVAAGHHGIELGELLAAIGEAVGQAEGRATARSGSPPIR